MIMKNISLFSIYLFVVLLFTGCSTSKIPDEFEELIPVYSNKYYIVGFENEDSQLDFFAEDIERFKGNNKVTGITIYYKVNESLNKVRDKYNFHNPTGFIVLEKGKSPYYVESYEHFLNQLVASTSKDVITYRR